MTRQELEDILILYRAEGVSHRQTGKLIAQAGGLAEVFAAPPAVLARWGLKRSAITTITSRMATSEIKAEADFVEKNGIRAIGFWEEDYPPLLRECPDAPVLLFGRGSFDFKPQPLSLSIVGTRSITPYGASVTEEIVRALAPFSPVIVSGLAYGVDVHAHRAALKYGLPTIGILGQGLGTPLYPSQNRETARQMCATPGCGVMTEYQHLQAALPALFPARNRIVAGISRATIVVEAKAKGGALITAELAGGYNREVFAVPGRISDPCSAGCNALIRRNKAIITDDPQIIIEELALACENPTGKKGRENTVQTTLSELLSGEEEKVVKSLSPVEKMHVDELCIALEMPVQTLSGLLLELEIKGLIDALPGKYYALSPAARG